MNISVNDVENGIIGYKPNHPTPITITTITYPFTTGGSGSQSPINPAAPNTGHKSRNHE